MLNKNAFTIKKYFFLIQNLLLYLNLWMLGALNCANKKAFIF